MQKLSYIFYNSFYKYFLKLYLKNDTNIKFDGFKLKVFKDVFHPKLFFSTKYFYQFISAKELTNQKFLEIGSGSGILSMLAYKKGARVTAIDIDAKAVENTKLNFSSNFNSSNQLSIYQSNLFENVPHQHFDFIAINPPYFFKKVEANAQYAWYCGENGEYYTSLFSSIKKYLSPSGLVFMILGENCEIDRIKNIAHLNDLSMEIVQQKVIKWERNFIFLIY